MIHYSDLSSYPQEPSGLLKSIECAQEIGARIKPSDLLPENVLKFVKGVDHIGFSAGKGSAGAFSEYQKNHKFALSTFESEIASKEFGDVLLIYQLRGGSIPLEIMIPEVSSRKLPQPHVAFSVYDEEDLKLIPSLFGQSRKLPLFMTTPMKNQKQNVTIIYLDGEPVRLEFIFRNKSSIQVELL